MRANGPVAGLRAVPVVRRMGALDGGGAGVDVDGEAERSPTELEANEEFVGLDFL